MSHTALGHEILEAMQRAWAAESTAATHIPGGLWFHRAPQTVNTPYAVVQLEEAKKTLTLSGDVLANMVARVTVYSSGGPGGASAKPISNLLGYVFDHLQKRQTLTGGLLINFAPVGASLQIADGLRQAEDVMLTQSTWEVLAWGWAT